MCVILLKVCATQVLYSVTIFSMNQITCEPLAKSMNFKQNSSSCTRLEEPITLLPSGPIMQLFTLLNAHTSAVFSSASMSLPRHKAQPEHSSHITPPSPAPPSAMELKQPCASSQVAPWLYQIVHICIILYAYWLPTGRYSKAERQSSDLRAAKH